MNDDMMILSTEGDIEFSFLKELIRSESNLVLDQTEIVEAKLDRLIDWGIIPIWKDEFNEHLEVLKNQYSSKASNDFKEILRLIQIGSDNIGEQFEIVKDGLIRLIKWDDLPDWKGDFIELYETWNGDE